MMDSTTFNVIAVIIYVICIPGICFSVTSICIICAKPSFHNAFGCLCVADIIAEGGLLLNFFIAVSLALIFPTSLDSTLMASLGYLSIFIHRTISYFQFFKSFNRFFAVVFYWKYSNLFNFKNTVFLIVLSVGLSIFQTQSYLDYSCNLIFSLKTLGWQRRDATKCIVWGTDLSFFMIVALLSGSILFNALTIAYLRFRSKKMIQKRKLSWIEKRFLLQTFTTSIIYVAALCCRYLVTPFGTTIVIRYMLGSGCWIFFCLLNEIIFVTTTINFKSYFKSSHSVTKLFVKN